MCSMFKEVNERIDATVYPNENGEVTAERLNDVLHDMCDAAEDGIIRVKALTEDNSKILTTKQDNLVSGKNIKTINGYNIVGSGNIDLDVDREMSGTSTNPVQNMVVKDYIDSMEDKNKGYYSSVEALSRLHPDPRKGSRAYVGDSYPYSIYVWDDDNGVWVDSGETGGTETVPLGEYYKMNQVDAYFVSKEDIKEYSTTEQIKDLIGEEFAIITIDEYDKLPVKEDKLYFCTE